jgi:hypothetical protein
MAGGPNAAVIPCLFCAGPADRQSEGLETDYYRCRSCGAGFGFDFEEAGPPERPMWPITPEQRSQILGTMVSKKPDRS